MKLTRYNGHVPLFSQNMEGRERTLFGSTVQDDDINNQFTPEFLRGWGSVGSTEFPTLQDFNALAYTHNKLLSYLYQAGIPSYTQNEEYYIGSIVQYNKDIYICLRDKPTVLPTDTNAWKRVQESLTFVGNGPEVMKRGAGGWLGNAVGSYTSDSIDSINEEVRTCIIRGDGTSQTSNVQRWGGGVQVVIGSDSANNKVIYRYQMTEQGVECLFKSNRFYFIFNLYSDKNTRTDKNNVLHSGTSTPINTLNVSDMSQEVINNDLLTVTSGAVYRALQPKADSTYVNTELNKKANLTYVNTELGKKWDVQNTVGNGDIVRESEIEVPVDQIFYFDSAIPPSGYIARNGQTISQATMPKLFARYGANMPDDRDRVHRMTGTLAGAVGTTQEDAIRNITGEIGTTIIYDDISSGAFIIKPPSGVTNRTGAVGSSNKNIGFDASLVVPTAAENRVKSRIILACNKIQ